MYTGKAGIQTADPQIIGQPTLPPEPQPPMLTADYISFTIHLLTLDSIQHHSALESAASLTQDS